MNIHVLAPFLDTLHVQTYSQSLATSTMVSYICCELATANRLVVDSSDPRNIASPVVWHTAGQKGYENIQIQYIQISIYCNNQTLNQLRHWNDTGLNSVQSY